MCRETQREIRKKHDYAEDNPNAAENDATHILVIERVADALKRTGQMMRLATVTPATIRHSSIDDALGG
jgi:hypothetical protein